MLNNVLDRIEQKKIKVYNNTSSFLARSRLTNHSILYLVESIYNDCLKIINEELEKENNHMSYKSDDIHIPELKIKDVNIIVPNKVVEVIFRDKTKEKAVCHEDDVFSLETAIGICISKKIMGGSSAYNNAVKRGIKVYEDKLKKEEFNKAEQERIEKRRAKRQAYKERRVAKREEIEKEKQIEIQKEAYIRAMEYMNNSEYVQAK